jgi:hypothetical protein
MLVPFEEKFSIHYVQYSDLTFFNYYHENHTKLYFHKFLAHLTQRVRGQVSYCHH